MRGREGERDRGGRRTLYDLRVIFWGMSLVDKRSNGAESFWSSIFFGGRGERVHVLHILSAMHCFL